MYRLSSQHSMHWICRVQGKGRARCEVLDEATTTTTTAKRGQATTATPLPPPLSSPHTLVFERLWESDWMMGTSSKARMLMTAGRSSSHPSHTPRPPTPAAAAGSSSRPSTVRAQAAARCCALVCGLRGTAHGVCTGYTPRRAGLGGRRGRGVSNISWHRLALQFAAAAPPQILAAGHQGSWEVKRLLPRAEHGSGAPPHPARHC